VIFESVVSMTQLVQIWYTINLLILEIRKPAWIVSNRRRIRQSDDGNSTSREERSQKIQASAEDNAKPLDENARVWPKAPVRRLVYYSVLYAGSAALLKVAGFVFFLWLARALDVKEYAHWGLLYALQTAIVSFGIAGVTEAVIPLVSHSETTSQRQQIFASANGAFLITLSSSLVLALILFIIFFRHGAESYGTMAWVCASGGLSAFSTLQAQLVRLEEKHGASMWFNFAVPLLGLLGSGVAFFTQRTVQSFFLGSSVGMAAGLLAARILGLGTYSFALDLQSWRPVLERVFPFVAVTLIGWIGGYGNSYLIKALFDSTAVAQFTFAFMLSSIMQMVATAMNQVWGPRFYNMIHRDPIETVEAQNRKFSRLQGVILGAAGAVLIACYPAGIRLLGGNLSLYANLGKEILLLILAYVALVPWWHCQNYYLVYDKGTSVMRILLSTTVLSIAGLAVLIPAFGPAGIYFGFLLQMALRSSGALAVSGAYWRITMAWDGILLGMAISIVSFVLFAQ